MSRQQSRGKFTLLTVITTPILYDDDDVSFSFKSNLSSRFWGRTPSFYKQTLPPRSAILQYNYSKNHHKNTSTNTLIPRCFPASLDLCCETHHTCYPTYYSSCSPSLPPLIDTPMQISEQVSIKSGVPQGAIWSPLLFDLFVRNVPQRVREVLCLFYAGNLTLLKVIERNNEAAQDAQQELNQHLERLFRFGKEWLLEFEATKSFGLTISNSKGKDLKGRHMPHGGA